MQAAAWGSRERALEHVDQLGQELLSWRAGHRRFNRQPWEGSTSTYDGPLSKGRAAPLWRLKEIKVGGPWVASYVLDKDYCRGAKGTQCEKGTATARLPTSALAERQPAGELRRFLAAKGDEVRGYRLLQRADPECLTAYSVDCAALGRVDPADSARSDGAGRRRRSGPPKESSGAVGDQPAGWSLEPLYAMGLPVHPLGATEWTYGTGCKDAGGGLLF